MGVMLLLPCPRLLLAIFGRCSVQSFVLVFMFLLLVPSRGPHVREMGAMRGRGVSDSSDHVKPSAPFGLVEGSEEREVRVGPD